MNKLDYTKSFLQIKKKYQFFFPISKVGAIFYSENGCFTVNEKLLLFYFFLLVGLVLWQAISNAAHWSEKFAHAYSTPCWHSDSSWLKKFKAHKSAGKVIVFSG